MFELPLQKLKLKGMSRIPIHEFDPVIYPYKVWIVIKDIKAIKDNFIGNDGESMNDIDENTKMLDAFVIPARKTDCNRYGVVVFFSSKKSMTYNIVAHEASHAAKYLFKHIGADIYEHEPFEYVVGWIAECCEKVLKNKD